jgi:hypothetical protein
MHTTAICDRPYAALDYHPPRHNCMRVWIPLLGGCLCACLASRRVTPICCVNNFRGPFILVHTTNLSNVSSALVVALELGWFRASLAIWHILATKTDHACLFVSDCGCGNNRRITIVRLRLGCPSGSTHFVWQGLFGVFNRKYPIYKTSRSYYLKNKTHAYFKTNFDYKN